MIELICPLCSDHIIKTPSGFSCSQCEVIFPMIDVENKKIPDFRCCDLSLDISLKFTIPQQPLPTGSVDHFGKATDANFQCPPREKLRKLFGTKLQKEVLYYIDNLRKQVGTDAVILDLGCGNGGNKKYLESIGFHNVHSVDYMSSGAEYLIDVHRLPFASDTFDMILTTATLEHFYNPYIAFKEMSRVLKNRGKLLASGSFLEGWHGDSCFHFTPGGLTLLCQFSNLDLSDMWPGWGFIPSISTHALGMKRFKKWTYLVQRVFDFTATQLVGCEAYKKRKFRTSGAFGIFAEKRECS